MITVTEYAQKELKYSVVYDQSARVLDIESSTMSDDCIPYEESTGCMAWLDKNNTLCEMECIFPVIIESIGDLIGNDADTVNATPILKVSYEEKPVELFFNHEQLILILNHGKRVDKKYISSGMTFCVSGDELVAIVCTDFELT